MTPPVLLHYQRRWVADQAPIKIIEKSRRIGLTWAEASDDVLSAGLAPGEGGMNVWYIGYNQEMARTFIADCAMWARAFNQAAETIEESVLKGAGVEGDDILIYRIKMASGFAITALSSRPAELRGKGGIVVIDEAAFHDDLAELLKAAIALTIWGGKVRIVSTHNGDDNPFNDLVNEVRAGKKHYSLHRVTFREAVAQGLYDRVCLKLGTAWSPEGQAAWVEGIYQDYGDAAAEELDVVPKQGGGAWLTRALIEHAMVPGIPVARLNLPPEFTFLPEQIRVAEVESWCNQHLLPLILAMPAHLRSFLGEDFARTGDLTVLWPLQQTATLQLVTPFTVELRGVPFEQQRQILFFIASRLPRFTAGAFDARGNGQYLAEVAAQKFGASRIAQVPMTAEWYRENMPRLKAALEDRTLALPKDADILDDLRGIQMDKGVARVGDRRMRGTDGRERHGDSAVALAMALHAVHAIEPVPLEFHALGQPRAGAGLFNEERWAGAAGGDGGWHGY